MGRDPSHLGDSHNFGRRVTLEVVLYVVAARAELVEAEEHVPRGRARLGTERAPPLRRVAERVEDPRHVQVR